MTEIEAAIERVVQRYVTQIQDLYNEVPDLLVWAFLAAMKVFLDSLIPHLDPAGRALYDDVVNNSETTIFPRAADPRLEGNDV